MGRRSFDIWLSDLEVSLYQFLGIENDTTTVESADKIVNKINSEGREFHSKGVQIVL